MKKRFLCKLISIIFVNLYILLKGIYSTFNYDLTHEFLNKKKKIIQPVDNQEIDPVIGGSLLDDLKSAIGINREDNEDRDKTEESNEQQSKDINLESRLESKEESDKEDNKDRDENDKTEESNEEQSTDINLESEEESDESTYNNLFHAFVNAIYGLPLDTIEKNINKEFPESISELESNLKKSNIFNIFCNDNIYEIIKTNILFNDDNLDLIYKDKNDNRLLSKIKDFIKNLNNNNDDLKFKEKELEKSIDKFKKNTKKMCEDKLLHNFSLEDKNRINEQIHKKIKLLFNEYTRSRNKLFTDIIQEIFIFKDKYIKNNDTNKKEKIKGIKGFKDNVTISTIIKLSVRAKIIILSLYIEFFNKLLEIFSLLNDGISSIDDSVDDESDENEENENITDELEQSNEEQSKQEDQSKEEQSKQEDQSKEEQSKQEDQSKEEQPKEEQPLIQSPLGLLTSSEEVKPESITQAMPVEPISAPVKSILNTEPITSEVAPKTPEVAPKTPEVALITPEVALIAPEVAPKTPELDQPGGKKYTKNKKNRKNKKDKKSKKNKNNKKNK